MENRFQRRKRQRGIKKMLKQQELTRDIACKTVADKVKDVNEWSCCECGNQILIFEMKDGSGTFKVSKPYEEMCDSCKEIMNELKGASEDDK